MIAKFLSYFQFSPEMLSDTLSFFTASLRTANGIEKNIIAKKCLEKITYTPDQIKFSFCLKQEPMVAPDGKNAPVQMSMVKNAYAPENENPTPMKESDVRIVSKWYLPNSPTNFEVAVPNVIHGTKLLNLPARRAEAQK